MIENSKHHVHRWWLNLILMGLSLLLALILIEIFLRYSPFIRLLPPPFYVGEYENRADLHRIPDANTGWKLKPRINVNQVQSNAQGFRGATDFDPLETRKKIILIGDSFTFGTGAKFEDTYGSLIDSSLSHSVVYNLAMPGFGMDQMLMSLRHQALPLNPQLVIVGFVDVDFDRSLSAYDMGKGFTRPALKMVEDGLLLKTEKDNPNLLIKALERRTKVWMALASIARFFAFRVPIGEWWYLNEAILDNIRTEASGGPLYLNTPSQFLSGQ